MNAEKHKRVKALFLAVCARPADERSAYLADACGDDAELLAEVASLIDHDRESGGEMTATMPLADGMDARVSMPPPDSFAGYDIMRAIHSGGQGTVYQAVQKATRRKVAIKVMREGPFARPRERVRFEREIQILGQLNHPNIVGIHDSGVASGSSYFVMDYISGQPLDEYVGARIHASDSSRGKSATASTRLIPRDGSTAGQQSGGVGAASARSLSPDMVEELLRLFAKICDAVNAAHLRGVIHRDLKPGNIRIDSAGEPHILDFGLAKTVLGDSGGDVQPELMTMTGQFFGSLPWASPEQAEAVPGKIDTRTDVYALGVILYHMLTGRFPYVVMGSMHDVLHNILNIEPERPSLHCKQINDEIETIILKCLNKQRERRYQTAGELARDIGHYLAGEPIEAKRDSALYVLRKQLRRYRAPVIVAGAFVAVIVGALLVSLGFWRSAARQRDLATEAAADADKKFMIARAGADLLLFGICEKLPKVAGTRELQKELLEKAREYYERLAAERPGDLEQQRGIWVSFQMLADSYLALGELERARELFQEFHRMVGRAVVAEPRNLQFLKDLSVSHHRLGEVASKSGDVEQAADHMRKQLELAEHITAMDSRNTDFQERLVSSLLTVGRLAQQRGDLDKAGDSCGKALELAERQGVEQPGIEKLVPGILLSLGDIARLRRNVDQARDYYDRALDILERTSGGAVSDPAAHEDLAAAFNRLGDLALKEGNFDRAAELFGRHLRIAEKLAAAEPRNNLYQDHLSVCYARLADVAMRRRELTQAVTYFDKQMAITARLAADEPRNPRYQAMLAASHDKVGDLFVQLEDRDRARENFIEVLAIGKRLSTENPGTPAYEALMSTAYQKLARIAKNLGDAEGLRTYTTELIALRRARAARPQALPEDLNVYAWLLLTCEPEEFRDVATAFRVARKAVDLTQEQDPGILDTLALALHMSGDTKAALETQERAVALLPSGESPMRRRLNRSLGRYRMALVNPATSQESSPEDPPQ